MDTMASLWTYQESINELKQQLFYTSMELESVKAEAGEQMKIHKEYEKQSLQLLKMVIQERDEAKQQLHKLLNKLMACNSTTLNTEFSTIVVPQVSLESPLVKPVIPNLSTTESNSFSDPYTYHSYDSSPVSSFFEPVLSPELSNISSASGDLSDKMKIVSQPYVQDYKSINPTTIVPPSGASKVDQVIDSLVKGKTLPQQGNLLQSVLKAGPLIQTLLVSGPLPTWRNPPPLHTFHIHPLTGKSRDVQTSTQKPKNPQSYVELPCESSQVTSNSVLNFQDVASRSCLRTGSGMISPGPYGNTSFPTIKRQRFL
ncbi:ATP synthase subunit b like [Heracleum sosnowskyi]|uniref:ATP synthase subunit b like n=1 Tax=Heracleum sosnowskyi TaxID=360622 RepID=A0AAD8J9U2_9APIA|nr:ATP synthase subunit b like [Heracleum sosnowskyi]